MRNLGESKLKRKVFNEKEMKLKKKIELQIFLDFQYGNLILPQILSTK